jgi:hypothetical protein
MELRDGSESRTADVASWKYVKEQFCSNKIQTDLFFPRSSVNLLFNYDVYILNDIRYACSTENACVPFDFGQGH